MAHEILPIKPRSLIALFLGLICLGGNPAASESAPTINAAASSYDAATGRLIIKGEGFQPGARVVLINAAGPINYQRAKVKGSRKIIILGVAEADVKDWVDVEVINPDGSASAVTRLVFSPSDDRRLTEDDVKTIIAQAVTEAEAVGLRATIAVVDKEGNVLGVFKMAGAPDTTIVGIGTSGGLEGASVPSAFAAISKAGTAAFLSSQGHAFTTRTASFIVQQHFPPKVDFTPGGPLFGVQFSQLPCADIKQPPLPLGLSADPGGVPLYKNGLHVGGIGVEGDGRYTADLDPADSDQPVEELVAVAGTRGFEAPPEIRGDQIIVNGIRFPFVNTPMPPARQVPPFGSLRGQVDPRFPIRSTPPSRFRRITLGGLEGRVDDRFFPFRSGSALTAAEVERIITQAAAQAFITRAAIRQPIGSPAEVNIAVVDLDGTVLGIFSTPDAPIFGFDVCVQKARTAAFFSKPGAADDLRRAEGGKFARYVQAAARDGIKLDGSIAFSNRGIGFLSRPFFPDGIDGTEHGPFSVPIGNFSPFNNGLQLDLVTTALVNILSGRPVSSCTDVPGLNNGIQIFPGSVPLYKGGRLAGAIGISGDGVDQDDFIASAGSVGFEAPPEIRCDRVFVRGVRLPFVKFPRHPNR
jgi:uncharacterized protein GlcG (DUF336 family)